MTEIWNGLYNYLQQGGWIMIPLVISSVVMWALIVERLQTFRDLKSHDISIQDAVYVIKDQETEVKGTGLRSRVIRYYLNERSGVPELDMEILRQSMMHEETELKKRLPYIAVLASIAPLLGLLGTVLGMIETFDVISMFGTGNAKAMASGVSISLITTQTGLMVAIPGLFISGMLRRRADMFKNRLAEDMNILRREIRHLSRTKRSDSDAERS